MYTLEERENGATVSYAERNLRHTAATWMHREWVHLPISDPLLRLTRALVICRPLQTSEIYSVMMINEALAQIAGCCVVAHIDTDIVTFYGR